LYSFPLLLDFLDVHFDLIKVC